MLQLMVMRVNKLLLGIDDVTIPGTMHQMVALFPFHVKALLEPTRVSAAFFQVLTQTI